MLDDPIETMVSISENLLLEILATTSPLSAEALAAKTGLNIHTVKSYLYGYPCFVNRYGKGYVVVPQEHEADASKTPSHVEKRKMNPHNR